MEDNSQDSPKPEEKKEIEAKQNKDDIISKLEDCEDLVFSLIDKTQSYVDSIAEFHDLSSNIQEEKEQNIDEFSKDIHTTLVLLYQAYRQIFLVKKLPKPLPLNSQDSFYPELSLDLLLKQISKFELEVNAQKSCFQ